MAARDDVGRSAANICIPTRFRSAAFSLWNPYRRRRVPPGSRPRTGRGRTRDCLAGRFPPISGARASYPLLLAALGRLRARPSSATRHPRATSSASTTSKAASTRPSATRSGSKKAATARLGSTWACRTSFRAMSLGTSPAWQQQHKAGLPRPMRRLDGRLPRARLSLPGARAVELTGSGAAPI